MYFSNNSKFVDEFFLAMSELIQQKQDKNKKEDNVTVARTEFQKEFYASFAEVVDKRKDDNNGAAPK